MTAAPVAVLGDITIDLTLAIPAYPAEGGEGIATSQDEYFGGSASNTARALSWLGRSARLIGRVGADPAGERALADLAQAGVETRWISRDPAEVTQTNVVIVTPGGERTMFAYRGANAMLSADDMPPEAVAGAASLHLSGYAFLSDRQRGAALRALDFATSSGVPVTLDIPAGVTAQIAPHLARHLQRFDTIFLGRDDLTALSIGVPPAPAMGARRIVVKFGAQGSEVRGADGSVTHAPGIPVDPVDTTGAGDAFAAGFIHAACLGLSPSDCCAAGNILGALAVATHGPALPERGSTGPGWQAWERLRHLRLVD